MNTLTSYTTMTLNPLPHEWTGNRLRRSCEVVYASPTGEPRTDVLWCEFDIEKTLAPDKDDCDAYLVSMLHDAMRQKLDIHVNGVVSQKLLENLWEYQWLFLKWYPDKYFRVEITTDTTVKRGDPVDGAVATFSGGLDALFTVWRHSQKLCGPRSKDIRFCLFIHGFDILIKDQEFFDKSMAIGREILDDIDIELRRYATNYRDITMTDWENAGGMILVAAMINHRKEVGTGLLGSTLTYDTLRPTSDNPLTDFLVWPGDMEIIHDGCSHTRSDKAEVIADWRHGVDRVRVCWEIGDTTNCGKCEKCMRTALNFLSNGHDAPATLRNPPPTIDVMKMTLWNWGYFQIWKNIYIKARDKGIKAPWVNALRFVLAKSRLRIWLRGEDGI